jgi:hypothetical protein
MVISIHPSSPSSSSPGLWTSNVPQTCYDAALHYAQHGIPVFPVNGKVPFAGTRGFYDASTDREMIRRWWKRWPQANVAIPTGTASGLAVLDIDGQHGGFASFRQLQAMFHHCHQQEFPHLHTRIVQQNLLQTLVVRTGSGIHLYFHMPGGTELRNTVEFAGLPGIDRRAQNGYVVAAPSRHPNGQRYRWLVACPPAPYPELLLDLQRARDHMQKHSATRSPIHHIQKSTPSGFYQCPGDYYYDKAIHYAARGTRHKAALWLACRLLHQAKLPRSHVENYLCQFVDQVAGGHEDFPLSEAMGCLEWAYANPRP